MRTTFFTLLLALFGGAITPAMAAERAQAWGLLTLQGRVQPNVLAYFEVQPRAAFGPPQMDQLLFRSAVGYELHPTLSLWLGFAWVPAWPAPPLDELRVNEGRLYQQLLWRWTVGTFTLLVRGRLEQRSVTGEPGLFHRARVMPRLSWTFLPSPELYAAVSNELFVGLTQRPTGPVGGYDQNRAYVGVGLKASAAYAVELGYLLQHVRSRLGQRVGHTGLLSFNVTL